jgi:SpoVK/Ycf46/Vps4 family AAA+-type ATPase
MPAQGDNEKLTLGSILQVFDGILETPGRIIIMTTNHPEKLDPALVRPGRVDVVVNFDRFTAVEIHEMFEKITGKTIPEEDLRKIPDAEWSAAQVAQKIFENWENEEEAIEALKAPPSPDEEAFA